MAVKLVVIGLTAFLTTLGLLFIFDIQSSRAQKNEPVNLAIAKISTGGGTFIFQDALGNSDRPLPVFYFKPVGWGPSAPIVFIMHGVNRDAARYRDDWTDLANKYNFLLVCPQFDAADYPTRAYQWGNMFDQNRQPIAEKQWTFTAVEHLFDVLKEATSSKVSSYYIYGHSAGGQFVHRFVLFMPHARYQRAIAANPGWYTMPSSTEHRFPYSLKNTLIEGQDLKTSFGRDFVLMLGEKDLDPQDPELNKGVAAEEQGATRFERGQNFFRAAQVEADSLGTKLNWVLKTVPGAHHSDKQMAEAAASVFFSR